MSNMILADIGNTNMHIYDSGKVYHLSYDDAIKKYKDQELYYVSVNHNLKQQLDNIEKWNNIEKYINLNGSYSGMGLDRQLLCLSVQDAILVDAGSAITVDVVEKGEYIGGYIFPGLKAMLECYGNISTALSTKLNKIVNLDQLPRTTKDGISYGIIASIKELIIKHKGNKELYFTGGDGEFLSTMFNDSKFDDMLVFNAMNDILKDQKIC